MIYKSWFFFRKPWFVTTDFWEPSFKTDGSKLCENHWPWKLPNLIFFLNSENQGSSRNGIFLKNQGGSQNLPQKTGTGGSHKKVRTAQHCRNPQTIKQIGSCPLMLTISNSVVGNMTISGLTWISLWIATTLPCVRKALAHQQSTYQWTMA